ncbi:MAG: SDR family NAD(P)-dependent oxidoreductase [Bacteroidetes bacterium]|nr:SDR family NAD(P)-dependent oxidoreductase [Bacteroidota bacterium]
MKVALITGVSRETGLGFETARQLSQLGYFVIVSARDIYQAKSLAGPANLQAEQLDVTDPGSIEALCRTIERDYEKLDVLINNAGAYYDQGAHALETETAFVHEALDTNLLGAWRMIRAFAPLLQRSDAPRIVNVSSGAGSFHDPSFGIGARPGATPVYSITKTALNALTIHLAHELKDTGIKINAVCPGFVATYPGTAAYGARPVSEGAKGIVWAATLGPDGPTGGFYRDGQPIEW